MLSVDAEGEALVDTQPDGFLVEEVNGNMFGQDDSVTTRCNCCNTREEIDKDFFVFMGGFANIKHVADDVIDNIDANQEDYLQGDAVSLSSGDRSSNREGICQHADAIMNEFHGSDQYDSSYL